jgi:hypothetical protein
MAMKPETAGELRGMVRDVLREVMAGRAAAGVESVSVSSDADLAAFVERLTQPATLEAVRAGKLRFTLKQDAAPPAPAVDALDGVITEQKIDKHAGQGALLLAPGAVLTPLARDKARRLGLKIERRR